MFDPPVIGRNEYCVNRDAFAAIPFFVAERTANHPVSRNVEADSSNRFSLFFHLPVHSC